MQDIGTRGASKSQRKEFDSLSDEFDDMQRERRRSSGTRLLSRSRNMSPKARSTSMRTPTLDTSSDDTSDRSNTSFQTGVTTTLTYLRDGVRASNSLEAEATRSYANALRLACEWAHGIPYFVIKTFLLVCVVTYTFSINGNCTCAQDARKVILQWGGVVLIVMSAVSLGFPQIYSLAPVLQTIMLLITLLVIYSAITYFYTQRTHQCDCAQPYDWRRWVVEYSVYVILALILLGIVLGM